MRIRYHIMTGQFYKYFDKNKENINRIFTAKPEKTAIGIDVLTGIADFKIGELNGNNIVSSLNVRRLTSKTIILLSTRIMINNFADQRSIDLNNGKVPLKRKDFLNNQDLSCMTEKISSLITELGLADTYSGQLFLNEASPSEYQSRFLKRKVNMTSEKADDRSFPVGYEFESKEINIRFMVDNTKDNSFISDLKLIEPKASHCANALKHPYDDVFYDNLLPDPNVLFSIDRDWKLSLFFSNYSAVLDILNMKLSKREEEELLEISFSF